eukprot:CAMPEP_0117475000 /NCGR_PEP_ID=MMETSP0784-20121206/9570_1 /TAXON_ID=39447 /ORGANISM="" /LENGTH=265 /DNA_ID=CAMNT_0005269235 /DNA_START=51 /DNA_END=845 /DNA_ORIENTATION=-
MDAGEGYSGPVPTKTWFRALLREVAHQKSHLVIRFEMPFKVQCLRCGGYINQGTRYDADKKKVGKFFTTTIYQFEMRCGFIVDPKLSVDHSAHCNQRFVIRTDPKNTDYELAEGLRRAVQEWSHTSSETAELIDPEVRRQMESDPMFKVEKTMRNLQKEKNDKERLVDLEHLQADREDTYSLNCALRRRNRAKRAEEQAEKKRAEERHNFVLPLAPPRSEDALEARDIAFRTDHDGLELSARRAAVRAAPLFASGVDAMQHFKNQ